MYVYMEYPPVISQQKRSKVKIMRNYFYCNLFHPLLFQFCWLLKWNKLIWFLYTQSTTLAYTTLHPYEHKSEYATYFMKLKEIHFWHQMYYEAFIYKLKMENTIHNHSNPLHMYLWISQFRSEKKIKCIYLSRLIVCV